MNGKPGEVGATRVEGEPERLGRIVFLTKANPLVLREPALVARRLVRMHLAFQTVGFGRTQTLSAAIQDSLGRSFHVDVDREGLLTVPVAAAMLRKLADCLSPEELTR